MNEKWFLLSISEIEKKLKTNAAAGLSRRAARSRGGKGSGHLFFLPKLPVWKLCVELLSDFSLIILLLGAIFSLFFEIDEYLRGVTVLTITLLTLGGCVITYFRSQRTMETLSTFFYPTAKVIRGGSLFSVDYRSVVVGDVILIEKGDIVCVDARLVSSDKLSVKMRTSADRSYLLLKKDAKASVSSTEQHAKNMDNMIHGGSVIETGSARAIVTATGKYTYIGAMTGGIPIPVSYEQPKLLAKIKKQSSKLNMIMLISVLPFTIISLLLGSLLPENETALSVTFLAVLAIAATTMSQLTCNMLKLYYTHKIRRLVTEKNPSVIKSLNDFDRLAMADYIFMLDGCAVTDGILHLEAAVCPEGEVRSFTSLNQTAKLFSEYVALYYSTSANTLTTGISGAGDYLFGMRELIERAKVDIDAIKIRCPVKSYMSGNMMNTPERILFTDMGVAKCLTVRKSMSALRAVKQVMIGGVKQPLSAEGIKELERSWRKYVMLGATPILFTESTERCGYTDECILGILVLKESIAPDLKKNLEDVQRLGCKVISFVRNSNGPKLPYALTGNGCVSKFSFERNKLPITYNFGSISSYANFNDDDIIKLISFAHSEKKRVAVIGFTPDCLEIAEAADCFITCSDIYPHVTGMLNEELQTSEIAGKKGSFSCIQTVKEAANCLITRPRNGCGGLSSLVSALVAVIAVYANISDYMRYMLTSQIIRTIAVCVPLILGDAILDARHVVLSSFVLDVPVFIAFMIRNGRKRSRGEKDYCSVIKLTDYFVGDKPIIISSVAASLTAIILPLCIDWISGGYDFKTEGAFLSLVSVHLAAFIVVYYGNNIKELLHFYKNQMLLIEIACAAVLVVLCFALPPVGALMGIDGMMSPLYFVISFVPVVIYTVVFLIFNIKKRTKTF